MTLVGCAFQVKGLLFMVSVKKNHNNDQTEKLFRVKILVS